MLKKGSEHTINDVRYDLELQIFHVAHPEEEELGEGEGEASEATHRRMAANEEDTGHTGATDESEDAHGSVIDEDDPLYQIQKHAEFDYAAISVLFSVTDADEIPDEVNSSVEKFFNDLELEKTNPQVDKVYFGKFMSDLDYSHRWIYKGSKTQPPCNLFVYWNVLTKIYPISQTQLDLISAKLDKAGINTEGTNGNYREVQKGFN